MDSSRGHHGTLKKRGTLSKWVNLIENHLKKVLQKVIRIEKGREGESSISEMFKCSHTDTHAQKDYMSVYLLILFFFTANYASSVSKFDDF